MSYQPVGSIFNTGLIAALFRRCSPLKVLQDSSTIGKMNPRWRNALVVLISGMAMGATTDPWGWWPLAWVAIAPLWWVTHRLGQINLEPTDHRQYRGTFSALLMGGLWGIGYHGMALFWITGVHPMTWMGVSWWNSLAIAALVWVLITLWGAVMSGVWAALMARFNRHQPIWIRILLGCGLLCALETLWSWGPLYWSSIAYTQSPHNLLFLQITQLSGQQTMTAALVAVNALLAEGFAYGVVYMRAGLHDSLHGLRDKALVYGQRCFLTMIGLLIVIGSYGLWAMQPERMAATNLRPLSVGVIQGNIPNTIKLKPQGWEIAVANYANAYSTLAQQGVEMILTPETALPFLYPTPKEIREPFDQAVRRYGVPVWLGGFGKGADFDRTFDYTNSLFLVDGSVSSNNQLPTTKIFAQYDKVRLVPVGEYIPLKPVLGGLVKRLSPLQGEVLFGADRQLVDSPWGRLILGICYESAYPEHFRYQAAAGGQLILTASNNAHYAQSMPAQHHAQDVARAIETNRWAVRSTNTGYSGIVDPNGRTIWISGINTYEYHKDVVYLRQTQTPYVQWGDWLTPLLLVTGTGLVGLNRWQGWCKS